MEIPEDTEGSPDDEEEVQTYEAVESQEDDEVVNLEDLEKVTLDLLVTKFLQGNLIFTIQCGGLFTTY